MKISYYKKENVLSYKVLLGNMELRTIPAVFISPSSLFFALLASAETLRNAVALNVRNTIQVVPGQLWGKTLPHCYQNVFSTQSISYENANSL